MPLVNLLDKILEFFNVIIRYEQSRDEVNKRGGENNSITFEREPGVSWGWGNYRTICYLPCLLICVQILVTLVPGFLFKLLKAIVPVGEHYLGKPLSFRGGGEICHQCMD